MFSHRNINFFVLLLLLPALTGCFYKKDTEYKGLKYPATDRVKFTFQEAAVPEGCKVFSRAIVSTPMDSASVDIKNALAKDGQEKGADLILIGLARTLDKGDDVDTFTFTAYGPIRAYAYINSGQEWEYGFSQWQSGEEFANFGYDKYKDPKVSYDQGLMIKHLLLRCQDEAI